MKNIIYSLALVTILFSACKKEDPVIIYGCTDVNAYNYNSSANTEDNTCINSFIEIFLVGTCEIY